MTAPKNRSFVVLNLPESVPALLLRARSFVTAMTGNAFFPAPAPSLAIVSAAIAKVSAAETATATRTRGTAEKRDGAVVVLKSRLRALQAYVQRIADADVAHAEAIITAAGMDVRKPKARTKPPFGARPGRVSGSVILAAKAVAGRAAYEWAFREDEGGTWTQVPSTAKATTVITGLPIGKRCYFRYRTVSKSGVSDWSEPISLIVD